MAGALTMDLPDWTKNPASADLNTLAGPTAGATTYTPETDSLVSGQLGKLLSKDSDYMTRARTRAAQASNDRGLLNSSLAASAGESAAIDAALPIAQDDARTFGTAQRDNTAATNEFARDANAFQRQGALAKFGDTNSLYRQGLDLGMERDRLEADTSYRKDSLGLERDKLSADTTYRTADLAARKDDLTLRREDMTMRSGALAKDDEFRREELKGKLSDSAANRAIEDRRLTQDAERLDAQGRTALAGNISEIRRQATQAQAAIESDPNMSKEAKANAITALSKKASADVMENIRFSGVNLPSAWPDWVNQVGVTPGDRDVASIDPVTTQPDRSVVGDGTIYENQGGY